MYTLGTSSLLEAYRRAIEKTDDLLHQIEACIDIHLVCVLGGEAQGLESPLHPAAWRSTTS